MLTRRGFAACAICAISGFVAEAADNPPAATTGVKRTILSQIDGPAEGYVTIIAIADIEAGVQVARHTHPGIESTYVLEGGVELAVDGQPARMVKLGETLQVAANMPHSAKSGEAKTKLLINYIVEKGKPIASPA
jgi:quercetin dioxygenase-like cupin family protein